MGAADPRAAIDDCLAVAGGRLLIEDGDAAALAERHGTPLHVVSADQLRRNARRIHAAFAAAWPHGPARLMPALKANPAPALRRVLDAEGMGCDARRRSPGRPARAPRSGCACARTCPS